MCLFKPKLPYPEEKPDYTKTLENTNIAGIVKQWLDTYFVPEQYHDFWRLKVEITVDPNYYVPAAAWESDGIRHIRIRPEWLNPGVIAHEQGHNSYSLLAEDEKQAFSLIYIPLKEKDKLIKLLYSKNAYGLTSKIEGHAELYRFLGASLPKQLKIYYPKLF